MSELIGTIVTAVAVGGVLLNNARRRECFLLWIFSNALSAAIHVEASMWSLAGRDAIFFALAIAGWRQWGRAADRPAAANNENGNENGNENSER